MAQDHADPIENSGTRAAGDADGGAKRSFTIRWTREGFVDQVITYVVAAILVAILGLVGSALWVTWTIPSEIRSVQEQSDARFDAEREKSDERFKAEQERSDERFKAERDLSNERFDNMLRQIDDGRRQIDDGRRENRDLLDRLYEINGSVLENRIRIENLEMNGDEIQ